MFGDLFEVDVGVGWDVLVLMVDYLRFLDGRLLLLCDGRLLLLLCGCGGRLLLLRGCGELGCNLGCYLRSDGRLLGGLGLSCDHVEVVAVEFVWWVNTLPCTF